MTTRYSVPGVGAVENPEAYGGNRNSPVSDAPVAVPVVTAPVDRTPVLGTLDAAKQAAFDVANSRTEAQRQADLYAATQRQARIDAINTTFAPRIAQQEKANQNALSRVAALNFNQGIVGSGVDTTKTGEVKDLNDKALQAIEDQKALAINQAFGWADELATKRAESIYNDAKLSADAKVALLKDRADMAMKALDVFGGAGKTAEEIKAADPNTYNTLREVSGMSDTAIATYLKTKAPAGTYQWDQAKISGNQMYVPKVVNGKVTMDTVDLPFTPTKEPQSVTKTDTGVFVLYKDGTYQNIAVPGSGKNTEYTIPTPNRNNLLKFLKPEEVDALQTNIRTYGLDAVVKDIPTNLQEKVRAELDKNYLFGG